MSKQGEYIKENIFNKFNKYTIIMLTIYVVAVYFSYIGPFRSAMISRNYDINELNIYGLIFNIFKTPINVQIVLTPIFLAFIHSLVSNEMFKQSLIVKFKNKKKWIKADFFNILISACIFIGIILGIYIFIGILYMDFSNEWTVSNILTIMPGIPNSVFEVGENIVQQSPIVCLILNLILMICYFIAIGMIFIILKYILKKNLLAFIAVYIISTLELLLYSVDSNIQKFCMAPNYLLFVENWWKDNILFNFAGKATYWIVVISILYFIWYKISMKIDLRFEEIK